MSQQNNTFLFSHVFVAGTFDGLHVGHRAVLKAAFQHGQYVTIGLTSDQFIHTYKSDLRVHALKERQQTLKKFLIQKNFLTRGTVIEIDDPLKPATTSHEVEALVVTPDNIKRGLEINNIRKINGLSELTLLEVPLVSASDGHPISSTRVRNGQIDGSGNLIMPELLRSELAQPLGIILRTEEEMKQSFEMQNGKKIITVGDASTEQLLRHGIVPFVSIIDQKIARLAHNTLSTFPDSVPINKLYVSSGPGYISQDAIQVIHEALYDSSIDHTVIIVDGEEDLLILPCIQKSDESIVIYYGQPHTTYSGNAIQEGLVEVRCDAQLRRRAQKILLTFISIKDRITK